MRELRSGVRCAIGATTLAVSMALQAQPQPFEIPAGDLKVALELHAAATGRRLAYRTETDPMEPAQSVTTIQRQLLEDQQARTLDEALQNVVGVVRGDTVASGFQMRGMEASVKVNRALGDNSSSGIPRPTFALESIEVVKGPDSITGGAQAGYGGAINLITKGADGKPVREARISLGSHQMVGVGVDVGDSLDADHRINDRFVAQRERTGEMPQGSNGRCSDHPAPSIGGDRRERGTSVALMPSTARPTSPTMGC